jgi:hypothetical protein
VKPPRPLQWFPRHRVMMQAQPCTNESGWSATSTAACTLGFIAKPWWGLCNSCCGNVGWWFAGPLQLRSCYRPSVPPNIDGI